MRGRLAVSVIALVLALVALVLGAIAAERGELSTKAAIWGAALLALVVAVSVLGIHTRARLLRQSRTDSKTAN